MINIIIIISLIVLYAFVVYKLIIIIFLMYLFSFCELISRSIINYDFISIALYYLSKFNMLNLFIYFLYFSVFIFIISK